ncbi:efflux RND transporter permease subunit [Oceanicoccus sp. KOV_DT_Chl]|uniref:efflux RND transporter permease subunit n=1 Tax=Oceanicoccus sp. KOV_DT_Chl TaxID=1904639 RepID=UPI000C7C77F7|nr:efflux RND transporter permease subunit [Oceanicoccus sp. KOV_DT_Chl]
MESMIRFCIDHSKLVNLVMVVVSILGIISFESARFELVPVVEMGVVKITTNKPGAGPEEIELAVTIVLEEELLKVKGVKKVYSRSIENMSLITLHMDQNLKDKNKALNEIQQAVDRAQTRLPQDLLEKPVIEELTNSNNAIVDVNVSGKVSEDMLRNMARILEKKLRTLPGIAGVDIVGYRKPEVHLQINPNKQLQLGLSLDEVRQALANRNVRDSGGAVMSVSAEKKVLAVGLLEDPLDVGEVVIRSRGPGNEVLVRDVAKVLPSYEAWRTQVVSNEMLVITLKVKKKPDADLIKTTNLVRAFIEKEQHVAPASVTIDISRESSRVTLDMLDTLTSNAMLGLISVFVILTLFFGRNLAMWVSLGLPFSVLACFYFLTFTPTTINTLTLLAMVLMLGMLVDDAIVTAECIQRFRELGETPREAAIKGTVAVGAPVIVSAFTTVLAFIPLFFIGGAEGQYVAVFPLVVVLMLGASLFQSKFILPNHLARSKMKIKNTQWIIRSSQYYERLLRAMLEHRVRSLSILSLCFCF